MSQIAAAPATIQIAGYQPHPRNYNAHSAEQIRRIAASLSQFGQVKPVVVWREFIIAGHGVVAAAKTLGWAELSAVKLPDAYPEHLALAYVVADNELARLGDPDQEQLAAILKESRDLDAELLLAMGYNAEEFDRLLRVVGDTLAGAAAPHNTGPGPELALAWGTAPGQVWELPSRHGPPHRLMCADSTDPAAWATLMQDARLDAIWTDPPYGVDYADKNRLLSNPRLADSGTHYHGLRITESITNDEIGAVKVQALVAASLTHARAYARPGAAIYVCGPGGANGVDAMTAAIKAAGWDWRHVLVWVKEQPVLGRSDYNYQHELILYGWDPRGPHTWHGAGGSRSVISDLPKLSDLDKQALILLVRALWNARGADVLHVAKPRSADVHPTMKPVKLVNLTAGNNTQPGDSIVDPFCGSGTLLIACEEMGRRGYGLELTPAYTAVILDRYQKTFGQPPRQVAGSAARPQPKAQDGPQPGPALQPTGPTPTAPQRPAPPVQEAA